MKQKLTRFLAGMTLGALLFANMGSSALAASPTDELITAVSNTMQADMTVTGDMTLKYGESSLTDKVEYRQKGKRIYEHDEIVLHLDLSDFPTGSEEKNIIDLALDLAVTSDLEKQAHFISLEDIKPSFTSSDKDLEKGINGMMVMVNHLNGKTYSINVKEILDYIREVATESGISEREQKEIEAVFTHIESQINVREKAAEIWKLILEAGFLKVSKNANLYTISFADEPEITNVETLIKGLIDSNLIMPMIREEWERDLESLDAEEIEDVRIESREIFKKITEVLDFDIEIRVIDKRITESKMSLTFKPNKEIKTEAPFIKALSLDSKGVVSYKVADINLPKVDKHTISITNFVKGILSMQVYSNRMMQENMKKWKEEQKEWEVMERETLKEERAKVRASSDNWYDEYIFHVDEKLFTNLEAATVVDNYKLHNYTARLFRTLYPELDGYYSGYLCTDDIDNFYDEDVSLVYHRIQKGVNNGCKEIKMEQSVQRQKALEIIVKTIFPDVEDFREFAEKEAFVGKSYLEGKNRFIPMNEAELAKIFSKIIDHVEASM